MSKSVLGNDPFIRGAASRAGTEKLPSRPEAPTAASPPAANRKPRSRAPGERILGRSSKRRKPATALESAPGSFLPAEGMALPPLEAAGAQRAPSLLEEAAALLRWTRGFLFHLTLGGGSAPLLASLYSALRAAVDGSPISECDRFGEDPELVREVTPLLEFLYLHYWRVELEGAEQLPQGPSIVLANQAGAIPLAGIVLPLALRRSRPDLKPCRWLADGSLLEAPVMGRILARLGAVRASPENAVRLLEDQHPVLVFPEGMQGISKPFSDRYHLRQFGRGGFAKLALRSNVPVVPAGWIGGGESMPLLARLPIELGGLPYLPLTTPPLPAKWRIKLGPPLDVRSLGLASEDDSAGVSRVVDEIRTAVSGLLDTLLVQRTAVFA